MTSDLKTASATCRVIAVTNQKGGVGKTTTAINLGTGLAIAGMRCLIIDMDPQGNASTGLGSMSSDREVSVFDALVDGMPLHNMISQTPVEGLDLVPGSVDLSGIDVEISGAGDRAHRLANLLGGQAPGDIRAAYDYVIVDCPPSLNLLTLNAMVAADTVLVPLQCEFFALEGLTQLLETVRHVQASLNPNLRVQGIVLTMYDQRNRLSSQVADDVRQNLGDIVFAAVIPRNVRLSEAPSHALPALLYDPNCAGSRAYRALTAELLKRDGVAIAA